jgi:hypothetical protein
MRYSAQTVAGLSTDKPSNNLLIHITALRGYYTIFDAEITTKLQVPLDNGFPLLLHNDKWHLQ